MIKKLGVFCGSSIGSNTVYKHHAQELGKLLAIKKIKLVYGGAYIGLMRVLANSVIDNGGYVIGIMPHRLAEMDIVHPGIQEMHLVGSMHERKAIISGLSDAFVAMPGGFGTLDELSEILSWIQLDMVRKPFAIFNINNFFDYLLRYLDHCVEERFLRHEHRHNIIIEKDAHRLIERIETHEPVSVDSKWVDELKHML
jgi:uncharacterized protein (TIGR00730 family)